jgi:hypothetical protein
MTDPFSAMNPTRKRRLRKPALRCRVHRRYAAATAPDNDCLTCKTLWRYATRGREAAE